MVTRIYTPLMPAFGTVQTTPTEAETTTTETQPASDSTDSGGLLEAGSFVLLEEDAVNFRQKRLAQAQQQAFAGNSSNQSNNGSNTPKESATPALVKMTRPAVPFSQQVSQPFSGVLADEAVGVSTPTHKASLVEAEAPPIIQLQTVLQQENNQPINAQAVLKDFLQTTDMMSPPPEVKAVVMDYLRIAERELRQPSPNVDLAKQLLLATAPPLDNHVSSTLGEPTQVVKEWAATLMEQQIDWALPSSVAIIIPSVGGGDVGGGAAVSVAMPTVSQQLQTLKIGIQQAVTAKDWGLASLQATEALGLVEQQALNVTGKEANQLNALHAVLSRFNAQALVKTNQPKAAIKTLQTSLRRLEEGANFPQLPRQKQRTYEQLSSVLAEQHQWDGAFKTLKQSTTIAEKYALISVAELAQQQQAVGVLALKANRPQEALGFFQQAYDGLGEAKTALTHPQLPQLANWIGITYLQQQEAPKAALWLQVATKSAKIQKDPVAYQESLRNLGKAYMDSNQTEKVQQVLTLLDWFQTAQNQSIQ
jgi:tetratricopeptide (TPR) repeat protein